MWVTAEIIFGKNEKIVTIMDEWFRKSKNHTFDSSFYNRKAKAIFDDLKELDGDEENF